MPGPLRTVKHYQRGQHSRFLVSGPLPWETAPVNLHQALQARRMCRSFSSEPVDKKETAKATLILNRQILYQNGLDITVDVIQPLN